MLQLSPLNRDSTCCRPAPACSIMPFKSLIIIRGDSSHQKELHSDNKDKRSHGQSRIITHVQSCLVWLDIAKMYWNRIEVRKFSYRLSINRLFVIFAYEMLNLNFHMSSIVFYDYRNHSCYVIFFSVSLSASVKILSWIKSTYHSKVKMFPGLF